MARKSYKLLVLDIDGTLIGKNGNILPEDKKALAQAGEQGIMISISTGRAIPSCLGIISELNLNGYHMFCDGAVVYSPSQQREIYARPLDKEVVKRAIEFARIKDISIDFYSATEYFVERETWSATVHRDFFGVPLTIADFAIICEQEKLIKAGLTATNQHEASKARHFHDEFRDSLHCSWVTSPTYPGIDFINVLAPGVSKGNALAELTAYLGIDTDEVIAIGDGNNDISLLSTAGLGIAMGNATPELRAVADYITLDVEDGGLGAAVKKFLL